METCCLGAKVSNPQWIGRDYKYAIKIAQRKDPRPLAAEVVAHWMCAPMFCVGLYRILLPRLVVLHSNHTRTSSKKSEMMQQACCGRDHRFERCLS